MKQQQYTINIIYHMKLNLKRYKTPNYCIGKLTCDGKWICDTIEDVDRGLKQSMSVDEIKKIKVVNKTAIPTGTYKITLDVVSPKYGNSPFYKEVCQGKVPRLLNVPGYDGVLIHCGNTEADSAGCIIVGKNKVKGKVLESKDTFRMLYKLLKDAKGRGEDITLTIK